MPLSAAWPLFQGDLQPSVMRLSYGIKSLAEFLACLGHCEQCLCLWILSFILQPLPRKGQDQNTAIDPERFVALYRDVDIKLMYQKCGRGLVRFYAWWARVTAHLIFILPGALADFVELFFMSIQDKRYAAVYKDADTKLSRFSQNPGHFWQWWTRVAALFFFILPFTATAQKGSGLDPGALL